MSTHSNPQKFLIPRSQRQKFFILFNVMTFLGWVVGGFASIAVEKIFVVALPPVVLQQPIWYTLGKCLSSFVFALIFGADQALVLHQYISGWLWVLATSFGWVISNSVSAAWIDYIKSIALSLNKNLSFQEAMTFGLLSTSAYIFSGIWLGFFQWLVLRRYTISALWWNFLPSISFLFISILVGLLSFLQDFIPVVNRDRVVYLSGQGFTAVILGIIPAIGLCTLRTKHDIKVLEHE